MATCVREVREQRGMTQAALAAKAGISREYLNQDRERPIRPEDQRGGEDRRGAAGAGR
jgi:transcriptional regulator with XRE-family HTH domain